MYERTVNVEAAANLPSMNSVHCLLLKFEFNNDVSLYFTGWYVNCHHLDGRRKMLISSKMCLTFYFRLF